MKEEEILKAIPLYLKLDDYKGVEVNQKMQEMVNEMDQFPSVASALQGIEAYLKKHPELNKAKPKKEKKKEVKPATEAQKEEMKDIMKMFKPKEEKTPMDKIEKIENIVDDLKKIMNMNEKENEKEHKQLHEEITETAIGKMKIKGLKELAKKHNISTTHKVNNKDVEKGASMLKLELMEKIPMKKSKIKKGMTKRQIYDAIADMDDDEREEYLNSATLKQVQIIARFPSFNVKLTHSSGKSKGKERLIEDIISGAGQN